MKPLLQVATVTGLLLLLFVASQPAAAAKVCYDKSKNVIPCPEKEVRKKPTSTPVPGTATSTPTPEPPLNTTSMPELGQASAPPLPVSARSPGVPVWVWMVGAGISLVGLAGLGRYAAVNLRCEDIMDSPGVCKRRYEAELARLEEARNLSLAGKAPPERGSVAHEYHHALQFENFLHADTLGAFSRYAACLLAYSLCRLRHSTGEGHNFDG